LAKYLLLRGSVRESEYFFLQNEKLNNNYSTSYSELLYRKGDFKNSEIILSNLNSVYNIKTQEFLRFNVLKQLAELNLRKRMDENALKLFENLREVLSKLMDPHAIKTRYQKQICYSNVLYQCKTLEYQKELLRVKGESIGQSFSDESVSELPAISPDTVNNALIKAEYVSLLSKTEISKLDLKNLIPTVLFSFSKFKKSGTKRSKTLEALLHDWKNLAFLCSHPSSFYDACLSLVSYDLFRIYTDGGKVDKDRLWRLGVNLESTKNITLQREMIHLTRQLEVNDSEPLWPKGNYSFIPSNSRYDVYATELSIESFKETIDNLWPSITVISLTVDENILYISKYSKANHRFEYSFKANITIKLRNNKTWIGM
jgi:hypothetical protein